MIRPIKMCCTPILPTAYGDALSYYEEICKLTEKMNEIIADIMIILPIIFVIISTTL